MQDVFSCEWCEKKYGLKKNLLRHICSSHIEEDVNMATKATTCKATAYKVCNRYIRTNVCYLFFFHNSCQFESVFWIRMDPVFFADPDPDQGFKSPDPGFKSLDPDPSFYKFLRSK